MLFYEDPYELLFFLRMPNFVKVGYKPKTSSLLRPPYYPNPGSGGKHEKWIYLTIRKNGVPDLEYVVPWVSLLHSTKNFDRATTGTCRLGPRCKGTQKPCFCPFWGGKKIEIQNFFFLQISLFVGPIDGINNIFFSEVTYWLYKDF